MYYYPFMHENMRWSSTEDTGMVIAIIQILNNSEKAI